LRYWIFNSQTLCHNNHL